MIRGASEFLLGSNRVIDVWVLIFGWPCRKKEIFGCRLFSVLLEYMWEYAQAKDKSSI